MQAHEPKTFFKSSQYLNTLPQDRIRDFYRCLAKDYTSYDPINDKYYPLMSDAYKQLILYRNQTLNPIYKQPKSVTTNSTFGSLNLCENPT